MYARTQQKKRPKKILRRVLLIGILVFFRSSVAHNFQLNTTIQIQSGDTAQRFFSSLGARNRTRVKRYLRKHADDIKNLQVGNYVFSGEYTPETFVQTIVKGPQTNNLRLTLLEGWSSFDIDASLTKKGLIATGEYLDAIANAGRISLLQKKYPFLQGNITNLEGYLYPDTYQVDRNKPVIDQLLKLQMQAFQKKVRSQLEASLSQQNMSLKQLLTLASIVEKEEKNSENKSTVAGILYDRRQNNVRLDADITVCYGYGKGYESCNPSFIVSHLSDANNPYNTRQNRGLPPQPISNPSAATILATFTHSNPNNYVFYLHDMRGGIHYANTLEQHNQNKQDFLK